MASAYTPLTGGRKPVPRTASTKTSASKTDRAGSAFNGSRDGAVTGARGSLVNISAASPRSSERSASSSNRTSLPASCSFRATTNPSPPLFPFPQIMPIRFARRVLRDHEHATAAPAFSISVSEGAPKRSLVPDRSAHFGGRDDFHFCITPDFLRPPWFNVFNHRGHRKHRENPGIKDKTKRPSVYERRAKQTDFPPTSIFSTVTAPIAAALCCACVCR